MLSEVVYKDLSERVGEQIKAYCKTGDFVLTSGRKSDFYVDLKSLMMQGSFLGDIAGLLTRTMQINFKEINNDPVIYVGGMELGSVPLTTAVCTYTRYMNQFIIRKGKRKHGTGSQIEGGEAIKGKQIVLIDDVLTTGGSIEKMCKALEGHADILGTIVVVDRQEADEEFMSQLPPVFSLFKKEDLI